MVFTTEGVFRSSYRKFARVGNAEPTTTEFRSGALNEWTIGPWLQVALRANFFQLWRMKPQAEILTFKVLVFECFQSFYNYPTKAHSHIFHVQPIANISKLSNLISIANLSMLLVSPFFLFWLKCYHFDN